MDKWIYRLREKLERMSDDAVFLERQELLEKAFSKYKYESFSKRYAKTFTYLLENISIVIYEEDRLFGRIKEVVLSHERDELYNEKCSEINFQAVRLFSFEPLNQTIIEDPEFRYAPEWFNSWGHCEPDWEKLIKVGINGLITEAKEKYAHEELTREQREFLECSIICCEGLQKFFKRGAREALRIAENTSDRSVADRMNEVAGNLNWISEHEPVTFYQGLQLVWVLNFILHMICGARDYALGRMDKYLIKLYEDDINKNRITEDEALFLIEDFVIKCNEIIGRGWEAYKPKRILSVNSIQYVMLAGMDKDGKDVTNKLSYLFLEAVNELKLKQPTLNVRWHKNIDEKFMERACQIASSGLGYPSFYNDHIVMEALENNGIEREDAVDYGYYGCNNSILMGKEDELREAWHNVPLYLELALNQGKKFENTEVIGAPTKDLTELDAFEKLIYELRLQIRNGIKNAKRYVDQSDNKWNQMKPFAFESVLMSDCIKYASNFNKNGSKYKHFTNHFVGLATVTNSLYSIKKIVYEEKRMSLEHFTNVLKQNWENDLELQVEVKNRFAKYGNDLDEVDLLAAKIANIFIEEVKRTGKTESGRTLYPSIYSLWHQRALGKQVGATADGRRKGEQLSESQSPTYNTEENGPTAVLNSIAKLPLNRTPTGGVNIKIQPSLLKEQVGEEEYNNNLKALITAYFKEGGMHMQINVVDRATLEDAKLHPQKYKNLLVRVVGYSAYFVTLSPEQQDEIIERTELS
jgi:formate C-acetyltransferase